MKILRTHFHIMKILFVVSCTIAIAFISYYELIYRTSLEEFFNIKPEEITNISIKSRDLESKGKKEFQYGDKESIKEYLQSLGSLRLKRKVIREQLARMGASISNYSDGGSYKIIDISLKDIHSKYIDITIYFGVGVSVSIIENKDLSPEHYWFEIIDRSQSNSQESTLKLDM